jgi:hydroxymethylglutaryl-CoA lyase
MVSRGIQIVSLADTVGLATAKQVSNSLHSLIPAYPNVVFGVHLHASSFNWQEKLDAALEVGCTRFDGALKGIGGCPMAQDQLVGNMDSSLMIPYLEQKGLLANLNQDALHESLMIAQEIFV